MLDPFASGHTGLQFHPNPSLNREGHWGTTSLNREGHGVPHPLTVRVTGVPHPLTVRVTGVPHPLTMRVIGVPQMTSQPVSSIFFLFFTAFRDLSNSRPVHSLLVSSHLFLCLPCLLPPFTMPCKMVQAGPDERETGPYHCSMVSSRWSGRLRVIRLPAGSLQHGLFY